MFDFLFNPTGRISRKGYLLGYFLPYLALTQIGPQLIPGLGILWFLVGLFFLWPTYVAVPVRRFHDLGLTGWYQAGVFVLWLIALGIALQGLLQQIDASGVNVDQLQTMEPHEQQQLMMQLVRDSGRAMTGFGLIFLVSIAEFLLFAVMPGQKAANRYGNDPLADGRGFAD